MPDTSTPTINDTLVRVYRLPEKLTNGFAFGGGVPITFINVDWFNGHDALTRDELEKYIRGKVYCKSGGKFLVLSDDPRFTFQFASDVAGDA